jgi:hypothetical protein
MLGDRVKILYGFNLDGQTNTNEILPVYEPVWNPDGSLSVNADGSANIRRLGGVKAGSTGVVEGEPIQVHRSQVLHLVQQTSVVLGGTRDFVSVYPIWLDHYQQRGWFPADHIKTISGGKPL